MDGRRRMEEEEWKKDGRRRMEKGLEEGCLMKINGIRRIEAGWKKNGTRWVKDKDGKKDGRRRIQEEERKRFEEGCLQKKECEKKDVRRRVEEG